MKYLKPFSQLTKLDVDLAGGKGASLGELTNSNIPVPPGYVVIASAYDRFIDEAGLAEEIQARLKEVDIHDVNSVDRVSNILRDVIHDTPMPEDLAKEIMQAFDELDIDVVAVRSSATAEDSEIASWAGELETYLNTSKEELLENIKKCWSSLFTPRAIFYRHEKNLIDHHVAVAIVLQTMVQSDVSGVAFTVHPVTEDPNQMIIEAGFGLGEALVSGQITPDSYIVDKADMMILDISVSDQKQKMIGKSVWEDITDGNIQKLSGKQIIELAEICKNIEKHYGFPCDIEWALHNNIFYITQSRPITTLKK